MRHSGAVSEQKRVGVLAGGWSDQRDASCALGGDVAEALRKKGFEVMVIDPVYDLVRLTAQLISARADLWVDALLADQQDLHAVLRLHHTPYHVVNDLAQLDAVLDS